MFARMNDMSPVPADNARHGSAKADDAQARRHASIVADRKYLGLLLTGVSALGFVAFATAMMASGQSGEAQRAEELRKADVAHQQLRATRNKAQNAIGSYAIVDADAGRYKVPVDRAIEVVAKNPELLRAPVPKAAPAEATAPADSAPAEAAAAADDKPADNP